MAEPTVWTFFYGSFMNLDMLKLVEVTNLQPPCGVQTSRKRRGRWQVEAAAGLSHLLGKTMSAFILRECHSEDVGAVLDLWRKADATPGVTDNVDDLRRAVIENEAHVLLAEVQGRVIGSIIGTFDGWRGNIYRLAVHPDCRRQGIARALVAEVEKRLAQQGAKRITALVEKDHPLAMTFWEAVGYRVDERIVRRVRNLVLEALPTSIEPSRDRGVTGVDVRRHNQLAWDAKVRQKDQWTCPVDEETIAQARQGQLQILLTPTRPVPKSWLGDVTGLKTLCLASGGGQQAPILAAAGANVTVLDNAPLQLEQDRRVAQTHRLSLRLIEGDMADLSMFDKETFDLIIHPLSNCFVPDVRPVWSETFRILRPGGSLLSGFCNPVRYIFDHEFEQKGELKVRHSLPYSDLTSLNEGERKQRIAAGQPLEFGHTLEDQIGGQLDVGFLLTGFFEDRYGSERNDPISNVMATFVATRVIKPKL